MKNSKNIGERGFKNTKLLQDLGRILPLIGMGATRRAGSDSYPYTIIGVADDYSSITIQRDN